MKINTNSVFVRYTELFELLHQRDRDLFKEVLNTLTEVAEVAYETNPLLIGKSAEEGITWEEEGIQFAFAEVA